MDNRKNKFPFRLATTSYIHKEGWAGNVEKLAPYLDEIELVFFESAPEALPDTREIAALHRLSLVHGCRYNVHLPIDLRLGSEDAGERDHALRTLSHMADLTEPLNPTTYTVHLDFEGSAEEPTLVRAWRRRTCDTVERILSNGLRPQLISVENLGYPFELVAGIIRRFGLHVCFDVGHLHLSGGDVPGAFDRYRDIVDIVHLYGIGKKGEHRSLETLPDEVARQMLGRMTDFSGTVSLEVFSHPDLMSSLNCLDRLWREHNE